MERTATRETDVPTPERDEEADVPDATEPRFVQVGWLPLPWIGAMTLPPVGVYIRRDRDSEGLRRHERVHWQQYLRRGFLGYYLGYLWAWIRVGFSYERHPWEIEARRISGYG